MNYRSVTWGHFEPLAHVLWTDNSSVRKSLASILLTSGYFFLLPFEYSESERAPLNVISSFMEWRKRCKMSPTLPLMVCHSAQKVKLNEHDNILHMATSVWFERGSLAPSTPSIKSLKAGGKKETVFWAWSLSSPKHTKVNSAQIIILRSPNKTKLLDRHQIHLRVDDEILKKRLNRGHLRFDQTHR